MNGHAFWTVAAGRGEQRDAAVQAPRPGEILMCSLAGGVSRGTEALAFAGRVPISEYAQRR